jgi:penicillin-binding protein 1A
VNSFFETSKKASKKRRRGLFLRTLRVLFNLLLILAVTALILVVGLYWFVIREYGDRLDQRYPELVQDSYVYDVNGNKIGEFGVEESRETVGYDAFGKNLPRAVVAVEDRRFYDHFGVDFEGVARAAWTDLRAWEVQEGGSSVTEQLMKNVFIPEGERFEVSFWRRFVQSALAFSYERHHTKKEILTAYLNTVYFGNGAYGAEMAAQRYFGKSAKDLTLSEAATLAGFLDAPSTYFSTGETEGSEQATASRDTVLRLMEEQGMISAAEMREAQSVPLEYNPDLPSENPAYAPFLERVRREVEGSLGPEALGRGGLRIYTTLDPELQHAAVESSEETLFESTDPSAAVVTVEPQSGAIRALAGQKDGFNLPLDARRQPGSSFKPIVLAAALKENISPESVYVSQELNFDFQDEHYVINNYDFVERGEITVSEAMAESDNTVFVQLAADVGLVNVVRTARALGITSRIEPYPSTAIGGLGEGVSPLEMASAYATFAGGGIHRAPYAVERIERVSYGESEPVYDHRLVGRRVMTGNQAAAANEVLRGVVEDGTASMFHDLDEEIGHPSAGKTGTTNNFADAWYVGYTPRLCTAVWVGYPEGRRSLVGVHGIEEPNGETLPMDLWSAYMSRATEGDPPLGFPEADLSDFRSVYRSYYVDF